MGVDRGQHESAIRQLLRQFPVVAIVGARQVGKSTLARSIAANWRGKSVFFDLEHEKDAAQLREASASLRDLRGLVVIDEVQRQPELLVPLRPLADRKPLPARFLLLGSAAPALVARGSESLAGRIAYYELPPFGLAESGTAAWKKLWLRGGYPRSFLAKREVDSLRWRREFLRTYLQHDVLGMGLEFSPDRLRRFWMMLSHWNGRRWNAAEFGRSFAVSESTARRWLDLLGGLFAVRQLPAWHASIAKRQVKAPKVYIGDTGLLHCALDIHDARALARYPSIGASFEGFAIEQTIQATRADRTECHHWGTQSGAELDLLIVRRGRRWGFEMKCTEAPRTTPSMWRALEDIELDRLFVVHQGDVRFPMDERIEAVPVSMLGEVGDEIRG